MTWTRTARGSFVLPLFLALMLSVVLLAPAPAFGAAFTGQQTVTVANNRNQGPPQPQIGVDASGNAILAGAVDKLPFAVQAATRPVGGGWSGMDELGQVPATTGVPSLAVDAAGNALLAWVDSTQSSPCTGTPSGCLRVFSRHAGSSAWTAEQNYAAPTALTDVAVALDGNGGGTVAWHTAPSAGVHQIFGASGVLGGAWGAPQTLWNNNTETPSLVRLAIDGSGRPVVAWTTQGAAGACPCQVRMSLNLAPAGILVSGATGAFAGLSLERNQQGAVDGMWVATDATSGTRTIQAAALNPPAATFGAVQNVYPTTSTTSIVGNQIVTAVDGESVALWTMITTGITVVRSVAVSTRPPGGTWSSAVMLDPSTVDPNGPALTIDGSGNATALWHNANTGTVRYAVHPHGGSFGGTLDGPAATSQPVAAADPLGNVHAAWQSSNSTIDTAVFDPAAPALAFAPGSPTTGTAGVAVPLAVTASDTWSNPVGVQWDFGDGQTGSGASASHAYGAPGQFTAKATATDASGNSASQTQTVTIAAAPGLPRPIAGRTINLEPVSGTVLVKVPGTTTFVPLVTPTQVQDGSIIDARKGRVRITIDNGRGGLDTADFYGGIFRFTQPKVKAGQLWFANLYLFGGSFKGCPRAPSNPKVAAVSKAKRKGQANDPSRSVRHLWGSGEGAFRTVGRFSAATVRGTTWLTDDHCNGTLTKVTKGKVGVRDFVLKKTIVLKAHKSYLAKPAAKKSKKR